VAGAFLGYQRWASVFGNSICAVVDDLVSSWLCLWAHSLAGLMLMGYRFYFDHNVSSLISQGTEFPLKKPAGFHWDIFLLGITTGISGVLGIPAPKYAIFNSDISRGERANSSEVVLSLKLRSILHLCASLAGGWMRRRRIKARRKSLLITLWNSGLVILRRGF